MQHNQELQHIINRLRRFENREILSGSLTGLQKSVIITFSVLMVFLLAEYIFRFSSPVRTVMFFSWIMTALFSFSYYFMMPASRFFFPFDENRYISAAERSGRYFPEVKDSLSNTLQIALESDASWSASLAMAEFRRVYNATKEIEFKNAVSFERAKNLLYISLPVMIIALLLIGSTEIFGSAFTRFTQYNKEFIPPAPFSFEIKPGNAKLTRGERLTVSITVLGEKKTEIDFYYKDASETDFNKITLIPDSTGIFYHLFSSVRNTTTYYAGSGSVSSSVFTLQVVDYPVIRSFEAIVNQPAYSGLAPLIQKDNGNFTALAGSRLSLTIDATKELKEAWLWINDSTKKVLDISGNTATGSLSFRESFNYKIFLVDTEDNANKSPVEYVVTAVQDAYPAVTLLQPSKDLNLSTEQRVNTLSLLSDDFGLSKVTLHYRLIASRYEPAWETFKQIDIPFDKSIKEGDLAYIWNVSPLNLATEDVIAFFIEVFDNDIISGPKSARTGIRNLRLPSIEELFAKADDSAEKLEKEMKEVLKDAEELKKELSKIEQNLRQDKKELTFEEKQRIEKAVEKFEELQKKSDEINQKLSESKEDLQKNNLLSQETLQKYLELQNLMNQLSSEEMKKAMEKMNQSLQNLDRKQVQQALEKMQFDEETFKKSLERTIELFKRVQAEMKTDELLKRAEALEKQQQELNNEAKNNKNSQQNEKTAQKQDDISKQSEQLQKEMDELSKLMEELSDMPKDELDKLKEEFEKQQNSELSQQAEKDLKENKSSQAQQKMQQLSKNFEKTKENLMNFKNSMQQQAQMQNFMDMMRLMDKMIELSKNEEELKKDLQQGRQQHNESAQEQEKIRRNLEQMLAEMVELSKKTFAITPEMGKALGDAKKNMDRAIDALQNRNGSQAANSADGAMQSLNQAASLMKSSMESMMSGEGGQGGGMMSLMQQMGQLSGQQMSLNQLTQQLQQGMGGNQLTPEQQGQLQRLAQQQELIQKSLEQLNQEAKESGKSKSITANMDDLLNKMQEVITDMKTGYPDDELIQKQERILSKLLDAQRSVNERDFEKERESFSGTNVRRQSPAEIFNNSSGRNDLFQEQLNKLSKEGFSKDYEELIRKYFDALKNSR